VSLEAALLRAWIAGLATVNERPVPPPGLRPEHVRADDTGRPPYVRLTLPGGHRG
jgi:hypothetical protein